MNKDLVSIIIPTYGRNDSLEKAIISAEAQTYNHIEIIVVDDNNPQSEIRLKNEKLLKKIINKYSNVSYLKHESNKNGAAARNTGIKSAKGKYIAFLDDDDEFLPEKIETQVKYLKDNKKYKCVGCSCRQGEKVYINKSYGDISKEILTMKFCFTTSSLLFEKDALINIGMFDERFTRHQDYELLLKYCRNYKIGKMEKILLIKGKNLGENIPVGEKAIAVKKLFIDTFMDDIERIDKKEPGFKKIVLFENDYQLYIACLKGKNYIKAAKYAFMAAYKKPRLFIKKNIAILNRKLFKMESIDV